MTRTKSRWKCTLKDGIMHINNKDILFNKVSFPLLSIGFFVIPFVLILFWTLSSKFPLKFCRQRESLTSDFVGIYLFCHFLAIALKKQSRGVIGCFLIFLYYY